MPQPLEPTRTFDEAPPRDSLADGLDRAHAHNAVPCPLELLEEIARGGMGAILRARDADIGRDVAVKVLLENHGGCPESTRRFLEEARIAGRLQHPGVAPVYSLGRLTDGRPYFAMKLIKGRTLTALLAERADLAADRVRFLAVFEQVCQTLAYTHAHGVIHRDLKPSNVMVGAYGEVQVMDWGLAKVLVPGATAPPAQADAEPTAAVSVIQTPRGEAADSGPGVSETRAGSVLGTPGYMAPEQACGELDDVDQRADVFGLGAILCEVLTGKPPFRGSGDAALKKARRADLEDAFARLDGCGADAELIALAKRCLAAKPEERPRDAGETAAAVTEYQRSVAKRLRQAELERTAAEARAGAERKRRRSTLALAASVLVLILVGVVVAAWQLLERTAVTRDVEAALADAASHQKAGRWQEVRAALERAAGRLGSSGTESLRQTLHQAKADADMVAELDEIRLWPSETTFEGGRSAHDRAIGKEMDVRYTGAFRRYGIDVETLEVPEAAARVRRSTIRDELLTAVSNWARMSYASQTKLLAVAEEADGDPWRRSFREAWRRHDAKRMKTLAGEAAALAQPPTMLEWLAAYLADVGLSEEAAVLLRQAQHRYPGDFWISLTLGNVCRRLHPPRPQEAVGYMRAAVAIRPTSAGAHQNLGAALDDSGDRAAAIAEFRRAIELDPQDSTAHDGLGAALWHVVDLHGLIPDFRQVIAWKDAIAEFRRAIELDPQNSLAQVHLGATLKEGGDLAGAVSEFRQALMLDPNNTSARDGLVQTLAPLNQLEEARAAWGSALERAPPDHDAWNGYAELCAFLGRDEEYRRTCRALLDQFGDTADLAVAERTARACLLLPTSGDDRKRAADLADRAAAAGPNHPYYPYFLAAKGLADYRRDRFGTAIDALQETGNKRLLWMPVTRPVLAMALQRAGRTREAREALAAAVLNYDWDQAKADTQDKWIAHVLRREAEELIVPNLAAFLKGEYQPKDNTERFILIERCLFRRRYLAASRLFADAFAADPKLADDATSSNRYNAACDAARSGRGEGVDAKELDEKERAYWRKQALDWLRADLVLWEKRVASDTPEERKRVAATLRHWQDDADLFGLRDMAELAKLPADEQDACKELWAGVRRLLDKTEAKK